MVLAATSRQEKREGLYHPCLLPYNVSREKKRRGAEAPSHPLSAVGIAAVSWWCHHRRHPLSLAAAASCRHRRLLAGDVVAVDVCWHLQLQVEHCCCRCCRPLAAAGVGAVVAVRWHLQLQASSSSSTPAAAGGVAVVAICWHLQLQVERRRLLTPAAAGVGAVVAVFEGGGDGGGGGSGWYGSSSMAVVM